MRTTDTSCEDMGRSEQSDYAMTLTEIAAELGISKAAVRATLHRALGKIRARPRLCARFRAAVQEKRRVLDARMWIDTRLEPGSRPDMAAW